MLAFGLFPACNGSHETNDAGPGVQVLTLHSLKIGKYPIGRQYLLFIYLRSVSAEILDRFPRSRVGDKKITNKTNLPRQLNACSTQSSAFEPSS